MRESLSPTSADGAPPTPAGSATGWRGARAAPWLVLGLVALAVLLWAVMPAADTVALMSETGPVEEFTAGAYFVAATAPWWLRSRDTPVLTAVALGIVMLAFGMRELDWHKAWTGTSVLRLSWYWSDAPMAQRAIALAILLPIAAALAHLALRHGLPTLRAARRGFVPALTALWFLAALAVSKTIDRSLNLLVEWFDLHSPGWLIALQLAIEETMEMALPLLLLLALWQLRAARERR